MLAFSFKSDYDEGNSYNWAQWKFFSAELATGMYNRLSTVKPMRDKTYYADELAGNIDNSKSPRYRIPKARRLSALRYKDRHPVRRSGKYCPTRAWSRAERKI